MDLLVNRVRINGQEAEHIWGDFLHFDDHPQMPSAVAATDMCTTRSTTPGLARQRRWCMQLKEYLLDVYLIRPRDGKEHRCQWGFSNLGEVSIATPAGLTLQPAVNADGSPWDPLGYYRKNSGHKGRQFTSDAMWQADWTLNEGNVSHKASYAYPPHSARVRLTMAAQPQTRVVAAWLSGPGRNEQAQLRQDLLVVDRPPAKTTAFVDVIEPIDVGIQPLVRTVEVAARGEDGALAVRVTTRIGTDWFLVGRPFSNSPKRETCGPFTTDAPLAVVRLQGKRPPEGMFAGTSLLFVSGEGSPLTISATGDRPCHFP